MRNPYRVKLLQLALTITQYGARISMFILFGTKTRFKTLSTGQFYCPQCRTRREYELRLARDYFTLYFIPLFPINTRGEMVTCLTCGTNFQKEVLAVPEPANSPLERMA